MARIREMLPNFISKPKHLTDLISFFGGGEKMTLSILINRIFLLQMNTLIVRNYILQFFRSV